MLQLRVRNSKQKVMNHITRTTVNRKFTGTLSQAGMGTSFEPIADSFGGGDKKPEQGRQRSPPAGVLAP
jgi:hypothetical protein